MLLLVASVVTTLTEPVVVEKPRPAIRIDEPRDGYVHAAATTYRHGRDHVRMSITLTLRTDRRGNTELELPIELPLGASAVGLTLAIEGSEQLVGAMRGVEIARTSYEQVVRSAMDPALLEYSHTTATHHRLQLRVFPVKLGAAAVVTLEIIAPSALVVSAPVVVAQSTRATDATRPIYERAVSRQVSLVALESSVRVFRREACAEC